MLPRHVDRVVSGSNVVHVWISGVRAARGIPFCNATYADPAVRYVTVVLLGPHNGSAMSRYRTAGVLAVAMTLSGLAVASPAQAAGAKVTGTVKPVARSCAAPRVARFKISLKHLKAGKEYLVQWSAPTRTAGVQQTQIPIVATGSRYAATESSRAATALLARKFKSTITIYAVKQTKKQSTDVEQSTSTVFVPRCTPRS